MWRPLFGSNSEARQKLAQTAFGAPNVDDQQQNVMASKTAKPRVAKPRVATPKVVRPKTEGPSGPGIIQSRILARQRSSNNFAGSS